MLRINKIQLFLIGFILITLCYFIRQVSFIRGSETTTGYVLDETAVVFEASGKLMLFPVGYDAIEYNHPFPSEYLGLLPQIPIIYKKDDPSIAKVSTFFGFWFENIAYFLVPLFLWASFSLSYLDKGENLTLDLRRFSFGKSKRGKRFPNDWNDRMKLD